MMGLFRLQETQNYRKIFFYLKNNFNYCTINLRRLSGVLRAPKKMKILKKS